MTFISLIAISEIVPFGATEQCSATCVSDGELSSSDQPTWRAYQPWFVQAFRGQCGCYQFHHRENNVGLNVVLFEGADAIKASKRPRPGEGTLDTCAQVLIHSFLDRLEMYFSSPLPTQRSTGQLLLRKSLKCIVWAVYLLRVS